jgi:hypothetical protein
MPSIFIWKSDTPNISKKTIRVYSGANWVLEDNESSSKSYIYLEQIVISESDNSVITFNSKDMPQDWVGSELLEVSNVPYKIIKVDKYGMLEHIGNWMRFTSNNQIEFTEKSLKNEFNQIKKWISNTNKITKQEIHNKPTVYNNSLDSHKINLDFQQFLIKYTTPQMVLSEQAILTNTLTFNKSQIKNKQIRYNK